MNTDEKRIILTLCFVAESDRVLLAMKKRGFGEGRWNGFGGKVQEGESLEDAAKRELYEESGLVAQVLEKRGVVNFAFQDGSRSRQVHIFRVLEFTGVALETEEMRPQWFAKDEIPYTDMWPEDTSWLPMYFDGNKFYGKYLYDKPTSPTSTNKVIKSLLFEVDDLEKINKPWQRDKVIVAEEFKENLVKVESGELLVEEFARLILTRLLNYYTDDMWFEIVFDVASELNIPERIPVSVSDARYKELKALITIGPTN